MDGIVSWYLVQPPPIQPALITSFTSIVIFVLGLGTILLNAWANRRNAINASRDEQKLQIYRNGLEKIDAAAEAQSAADGYLRNAVTSIKFGTELTNAGIPSSPPSQRFSVFSSLHTSHLSSFSELHRFIEQWEVVDRRLKIFKLGFSVQHMAVLDAFMAVNWPLMQALPADNPAGGMFPYSLPNEQNQTALLALANDYHYASSLLGAYIGDLNVELQTVLLAHLFGRNVERRDAPDPAQFALRLDRHKQITKHFLATPLWQKGAALDIEAREKFKTKRKRWPWSRV